MDVKLVWLVWWWLQEHVPHVDVGRFLGSDAEYRRTLILCLASTLDAPSATRKRDKSDKVRAPRPPAC